MTNQECRRAVDIITRQGVDDIPARDTAWLETHLAVCSECAEYASLMGSTGQLLRSGRRDRQPCAGGHNPGHECAPGLSNCVSSRRALS